MPAVLTHKTIMLLARQRLQEIEEALKVKRLAAAVPRSNIEDSIEGLATKALAYFNSDPPPSTDFPGAPFARPLGSGVSKFAVMGAMGPDIPAFGAALAPGQSWVFDNVHKGYPDENREAVVADTCTFIFKFWKNVNAAITAEVPAADQNKQLNKMRAYVLGHLCHLAADIISHPLINELEWRLKTSAQSKLDHADGESSHDALVAQKVLLRESTRAGAAWDAWWPTRKDIPDQFFPAYSQALEDTYTAISKRRIGLGEFEKKLLALDPPTPVGDFVQDGYSLYRSGIVSMVYHYTTWNWFAFLLPVWGPILTIPLLGAALEISRRFFVEQPGGVDEAEAWGGLLSLGFAFGSFASLFYSIYVAALTMRGIEGQTIYGIVGNATTTALAIVFFFTLLVKNFSSEARISFFVLFPAMAAFVQLVIWLAHEARSGHGRRSKLALILALVTLLPVVAALLAALIYWGLRGDDGRLEVGWFLLGAGLWLLAFGALGLVIGWVLRDIKIPENSKDFAESKQFVRLFDDATLYRDPNVTGDGLANKFFSSGRRELLKIWWEGPGPLFVRVDRYRLVFNFVDETSNTEQTVPAPIAPMKLEEFIKELNRLVKGPGGEQNKLKAQIIYSGDPDYELPPGATFSDHGEEKSGEDAHKDAAEEFLRIGDSPESPYILYHAPKPAQSVRFSTLGPVNTDGKTEDDLRGIANGVGYPYVFDPLSPDDQSIMGFAADFAAILCMGATTHLDPGVNENERVYQVFRNWSLDRRRVNEWRMLIAGDAISEKGGQSSKWDPAMLKPPDPAAYTHRLLAGVIESAEKTSLSLGWVPLLRTWLEVARNPNVSAVSPDSLRPELPGNLELSRGMAFLFDLPEPA